MVTIITISMLRMENRAVNTSGDNEVELAALHAVLAYAAYRSFEPPSNVVGLYGDRNDPVEVAVHEGELYRDENQIYPVAGDKYYIPVSGFTITFHRHNGTVDSIVTTFGDRSERVLRKVAP